jgi:hypothetical protein
MLIQYFKKLTEHTQLITLVTMSIMHKWNLLMQSLPLTLQATVLKFGLVRNHLQEP